MKNQPIPIKQSLWQVLDSLQIKDELCSRMIQKDWENILGASLAQHSHFISYQNHILTVKIDQSQWQAEFQHYQREIMNRLNRQLGAKMITKIQLENIPHNKIGRINRNSKKLKKK